MDSFIGGMDVLDDRKKIQKCKSIVGTPGRIVHLIKNNVLNTSNIRILVLDEVDKLMTGTFREDVDFIIKALPKQQQVIGSSATYNKELEATLMQYMRNPIGVTPKKEAPVLLGVKQFAYDVDGENLKPIPEMFQKVKAMVSVLSSVPFKQSLVFSGSQQRAESYSNYLSNEGWPCDVITGSQEQCIRLGIFKKFKEFKCRILVATDLMARGVDSENVNLVINLEVPNDSASYLHRIGRCGRFGSQGIAITLVRGNDELMKFRKLLGSIGGSDMRVLNFPKSDPSNIWNFDDRDGDAKVYGEICGITSVPVANEDIDKIKQSDHGAPIQILETVETVRKNLDLLEISKLLVDNPENNNVPPDEDLFESYSMIANCSFNTLDTLDTTVNNSAVDNNRLFIDAISRLNLYPDEPIQCGVQQSDTTKAVHESNNNGDDDLNSNTDGSNIGSEISAESLELCETGSDTDKSNEHSCSYSQSDSGDDICNLSSNHSQRCDDDFSNIRIDRFDNGKSKNTIEEKWNIQFMNQISFIQNYVRNSKDMNCHGMRYD